MYVSRFRRSGPATPPVHRQIGGVMKAHDTVRLPFAFSTPGIARTRLAAFLTVHRASNEVIDNALIVISEMIANAVSHGVPTSDGTIEISWAINGTLLELSVY